MLKAACACDSRLMQTDTAADLKCDQRSLVKERCSFLAQRDRRTEGKWFNLWVRSDKEEKLQLNQLLSS